MAALAFFTTIATSGGASGARAEMLSLEALRSAGYGVVPILRPQPNMLMVEAQINGHTARLILDTGAPALGLRRHWAKQAGIKTTVTEHKVSGVSGQEEKAAHQGVVETLRLGNVQISGVPAYFSDFGAFADNGTGTRGDGLLGAQVLNACSAIIDLRALRLYLKPPGVGKVADIGPALRSSGMTEVPFERQSSKYLVAAKINGVPTSLVLDTGAFLTTLSQSSEAKFKISSYRARLSSRDATGSNEREVYKATMNSFQIGDFALPEPEALLMKMNLGKMDVAGVLGLNALGRNGAVINCGTNKLYLLNSR